MKKYTLNPKEALILDNQIEKQLSSYRSRKNKKHKCMYKGCNNSAVNSHTISKKISLTSISENGHLKQFKSKRDYQKQNGKSLSNDTVGLNDATTFKGFCQNHEDLFKNLDNNTTRSSLEEILLQSYRSVCFSLFNTKSTDIYFGNNNIIDNSLTVNKLKELLELDKEQIEISENKLMKLYNEINKNQFHGFDIESKLLESYKSSLEDYINSYKFNAFEIGDEYNFCEENCQIGVLYKKVNNQIPVALLNHHLLKIEEQYTLLLITVIPYVDSTEIYWIFDKNFYKHLSKRWNTITDKLINILNMLESSMMLCENWYVKPAIINDMPKERLEIIEEDIYFINERDLFADYDLSIFDNLRLIFIENEINIDSVSEMNKINKIVQRKDYNYRLNEFNNQISDIFPLKN